MICCIVSSQVAIFDNTPGGPAPGPPPTHNPVPHIMKRITRKQFEIMSFIRDFIGQNGISPTLYAKLSQFPDEPDSRCCVDPGLIPDDAAPRDLFAVRSGVFDEQPPGVDPGDVLIVWTRPGVLHPGMMILKRPGSDPIFRTVNSSRTPDPDTIGRVVAVLRSL